MDINFDKMLAVSAGIVGGMVLLSLLPWWLLLGAIAGCAIPWYKRWRFKFLEPAEKKKFIRSSYGTPEIERMMYLGTFSDDETVRWWYWRDGNMQDWLVPQAVDNGEVYINRKLAIENPKLLKHLRGFWDMGNEWPAYYKMINRQVEHIKKKDHEQEARQRRAEKLAARHAANMIAHPTSFKPETIKAVASDLPRADYAIDETGQLKCGTATISALDQTNCQLLDLQETVKELEEEIRGRCPTLDFSVNRN